MPADRTPHSILPSHIPAAPSGVLTRTGFSPVYISLCYRFAEFSRVVWSKEHQEALRGKHASEGAVTHFIDVGRGFECLSEQSQDKRSCNKVR